MYHVQAGFQRFLDLVFPLRCSGCQRGGTALCTACCAAIQPIPKPFCQHCHAPLPTLQPCHHCAHQPLRLSGLRSVSLYQNPLRTSIHALKYNGVTRLAQPLGKMLAQLWRDMKLPGDVIVPVPLHSQRQRRRGYNHATLLAQVCEHELHIPLNETLLERIRDTPAQMKLSANERASNVRGAFRTRPGLSVQALWQKQIILIDDVCTTGATLEECAAPLFAAGARTVWGLVLARTA